MWLAVFHSLLGSISWAAPPSCPPESELQARLAHVKTAVAATVKELPDGAGFELEVRIADQPRTLRTPTCTEAADTTVFLAELVEGTPVARKPMEVPRGAPLPEVQKPPATVHVAAIGGAEWLLLREPVPRFGVSMQLDVPWLRVGLDLRTAPPLRFRGEDGGGVVLAPLFDAQAQACHLFRLGRLELGPCVQAGLGVLWAAAFELPTAGSRVVAVWTVGPAGRAAFALTDNLEVQLFVGARFGPQPIYTYDDSRVILRTNALGLDTGLGLGARW